jgi:ParB/RepB/Spo0J family partition protein
MTTTATEPLKLAKGAALHRLTIELETICPSPSQPRKHFDEAGLAELAESIKQHGVLEPILLRAWPADYAYQPNPLPHYELVAGERRWRAAKIAGLTAIEAKVLELGDEAMLEIQIIENLQRRDLTALEEADGYHRMVTDYKYSAEKIAEKIGQSKSYVYARLKLATLCHEGRKAFDAGKLDASKALYIARIPTTELQEQALLEITNGDWSVRRAAEHIQQKYMLILTHAPFPPNDENLVPTAGKCKLCPKRSGNAGDLFSDVKNANVCTDPGCYNAKVKAHQEREIKAAKEQGLKAITGKQAEKILPHGLYYGAQEGMVLLDEKTWVGGEQKTYRELVGDQVKPTAIVEDKRSGAMVPVVEKKQLAEALKKAGIGKPQDPHSEAEKERERKARQESEYRRRLHGHVREAIRGQLEQGTPLLFALPVIAASMFQYAGSELQKRVLKHWFGDGEKIEYEAMHSFAAEIPTMTPTDLCLLLIDLSVASETSVPAYAYNPDRKPEHLLELAKHAAVDAAAIKRAVDAEAKEKAKSKGAKKKPQAPAEVEHKVEEKPGNAFQSKKTASKSTPQVETSTPDTAKPTLKVQPENAKAAAELKIGDRVLITERARENGFRNAYEGKEGELVAISGDDATVRVSDQISIIVAPSALDLVAGRFASPAKVGDRVRILDTATAADGSPHADIGREGEIVTPFGDYGFLVRLDGPEDLDCVVGAAHVALLTVAPSEAPPPPTKAARAAGSKRAKNAESASKAEQAAPAPRRKAGNAKQMDEKPTAAETKPATRSVPIAEWPFPGTKETRRPAPVAAQAGESKGEEKSSGLAAERKPAKSQKVMNAKPTGERPVEAGAEGARCDKTADMFGAGK